MFNYFASKTASNFAYLYLAIKKAHKKQVKIVIGFDVILKLCPGVAWAGHGPNQQFHGSGISYQEVCFCDPQSL